MKSIYYILIAAMFIAVGCKNDPYSTSLPAVDRLIRMSAQYVNSGEATQLFDEVKSLTIVVCQDDKVVWVKRFAGDLLSKPYVKFEFSDRGTMYAIANDALVANMATVVVGAPQSVIGELYTSYPQGAPYRELIAMIDTCDLSTTGQVGVTHVDLERNMARFDVVADHPLITAQSIAVVGLARDGRLIKSTGAPVSTDTYDIDSVFTAPTAGATVRGAFYCHSFDKAVDGFAPKIEVTALYGGEIVRCYLNLEKAARNTFYRILLREVEGHLEAQLVEEGEMEPGDDDAVSPDGTIQTRIDVPKSTIDPSIKVDHNAQRIIFPAKGGVATIVLTGKQEMTLIGVDGSSSHFSIIEKNGKFELSVTPNARVQQTHPSVVLKFAAVGDNDPKNLVYITVVMRNYSPVEVITMAGVDWTVVNAQGNDPTLYALPNGVKPVARTLFAADWSKWGGVGEQWGPRAGRNGNGIIIRHPHWEQTQTYGHEGENGPIVGNVTMWSKHDYCPDGFRAPTREEFARIWPPAKMQVDAANVGPFPYSTPFGAFTVKYEKIGQNSLVISDGTNELIFPLMGMRGHAMHYNGDGAPTDWAQWARDVGRNVYYWAADRDANKNPTVFGYVANQIYNWTVPIPYVVNRQEMGGPWNADAHCTTRCVRPVQ